MAASVPPRHRALAAVALLQAAMTFAWSVLRHSHFGSCAYDLGSYHFALCNLAESGTPFNSVEHMHLFGDHLELGLVWIAALYRIAPTPIWLFAVQSAACAAAAYPIDSLARHATRDARAGLLAATLLLFTPQLLLGATYDFHGLTLCLLPMALLVDGIERDRGVTIVLGSLLALTLREQMGLAIAAAGVAWALRHPGTRRGPALMLFATGSLAFAVEIFWAIPHFAGGPFRYYWEYGRLGGSPRAALHFALAHPLRFVALPFEGRRPSYVLALASGAAMALPVALIAAWRLAGERRRALAEALWPATIALPLLAVQLFNDQDAVFNVHFHYGVPVVALFAATTVTAAATLARASGRAARWIAASCAATLAHAVVVVVPLAIGPARPIDLHFDAARRAALERAIEGVPGHAAVSAQQDVVPHLHCGENVHMWPDGELKDDFVLLDIDDPTSEPRVRRDTRAAGDRLRRDRAFAVRVDESGVLLVERRHERALARAAGPAQ